MLFLGIIGILLVIIGWLIANSEHFPIIDRVLFRKYTKAISSLTKMHKRGFILRSGDTGFTEITEILAELLTAPTVPVITQLKTLSWGTSPIQSSEGMKWVNYIELETSFSNFPPATAKIVTLQEQIKDRYRKRGLFIFSTLIFWVGIVISLIVLYLQFR